MSERYGDLPGRSVIDVGAVVEVDALCLKFARIAFVRSERAIPWTVTIRHCANKSGVPADMNAPIIRRVTEAQRQRQSLQRARCRRIEHASVFYIAHQECIGAGDG